MCKVETKDGIGIMGMRTYRQNQVEKKRWQYLTVHLEKDNE